MAKRLTSKTVALPHSRGGEDRRTSSSPRPAFAVWLFQRALPAAVGEVGKRGAWPSLSIIYTWRSFRAPPAFFCLLADLTAFALRLPTSGLDFMVSAQTAHRHAANPAPSSLHAHTVHDPCSREGDGEEYAGDGNGVERPPRIIFTIEQNQRLGGDVYPRGTLHDSEWLRGRESAWMEDSFSPKKEFSNAVLSRHSRFDAIAACAAQQ